jgi:NAD(P)-dependent dehydrogenase (short-subunit alcohol dehydrogenase family)
LAQRLSGKVALVTGGGHNVGRAVALAFAREGARVVLAGRTESRLAGTLAAIEAEGGSASVCATDVRSAGACEALAEHTLSVFGTPDVVACIAGGGGGYEELDVIDPVWWADVIQVNLVGTFHTLRAVLPMMRRKGGGSILTCTGGGAFFPLLGVSATAYATAKAGISRLTDQLAVELLPAKIRVNCLAPELTWSPERLAAIEAEERASGKPHPERAANHPPEHAAELAVWLASDDSAPLSGRSVSVNDTWWRDRSQVLRVCESLHAYTLRRVAADGCVPR